MPSPPDPHSVTQYLIQPLFRLLIVVAFFPAIAAPAPADDSDEPLPANEAAHTMKLPEGFTATLFAAEPDVMQPIGFCIDDRRRLWVAEAYNYPVHGTKAGDRIIILEDSDGDGQHDKRTVFHEGLNYVTGIEVGFGGAWVMSPPFFYFIPDQDADDRPDAAPQVLLDGFGNHDNAHNLANGFAWGPDGWLYGTHGRTNWSIIGKPGTPDNERIRFDGGVYRYHPVKHTWEPYADGTTNPWGIDWNDVGHAFVTNCVNPHLFQVIKGAHYEPWRGRASSQHAYQRIDTIADHLHFVGLSTARGGLGSAQEDAAGGGHAHCGTMIYLGDSFPQSYRNTLFTNNIHGKRVNNDILRRQGSGYVASHGPELMRSQDPWFMGVTLAYGPSGEIYVSDWSDTGECHSVQNTRRHTGRIFRVTYGSTQLTPTDLTQLSDAELTELQLHANDWQVRHARRILYERFAKGSDMTSTNRRLTEMFSEEHDIPKKLRALWALYVCGGLDHSFLHQLLNHPSEDIRSWSITLLCDSASPSVETVERFVQLAQTDTSPLVRLSLASALQRITPADRWDLASALAQHGQDSSDQNLPLMIWYGCEPLIQENLDKFVELGLTAQIPRIRINIARRIASEANPTDGLNTLFARLPAANDSVAFDTLTGLLQGLEGKRDAKMPAAWQSTFNHLTKSPNDDVRKLAIQLAAVFNDPQALTHLQELALNPSRSATDRSTAIDALVSKRLKAFDANLIDLLSDPAVRTASIRALSAYNHPETASAILSHYDSMNESDKQQSHSTLASRENWAGVLLSNIESGRIPPREVTAYTARQIRALDNTQLSEKLLQHWGEVRTSPQETAKKIASIKKWLTRENLDQADKASGQQSFKKLCANCHKLFGEGGQIGPDITGSQRMNLDYMLENIIDPNASVAKDYQMELVQTTDDRVITGLIESENSEALTIQTVNERLIIPMNEIASRKKSNVSIMPSGMLEPLGENEIRDLIAYLQRTQL
jgi:putative membrane-bound dehydrogenase-like protein